jgi:hypothetical protein
MSGIDAYNLIEGERYKFNTRHNIIKNTNDRLPHYYEATYDGRKGIGKLTWIFSDFIDTETEEERTNIEIKHFGILRPYFELIIGGKHYALRRKTSRRKSEKEEKNNIIQLLKPNPKG